MSDTTPSQADIMQEMQQLQCRFQQLQAQLQGASRLPASISNNIGWQVMNGNEGAHVHYFNRQAQVPRADGY